MGQALEKDDHGKRNAAAWVESLCEMIAAMNCDYDRLEELRDEMQSLDTTETQAGLATFDASADGEELRELEAACTIDGDKMKDADDARERVQESPLSVEVRGGWYCPAGDGDTGKAEEFQILLTTGGPALRIRGELDSGQPSRAWLEYQDWGTSWTQYFDVEQSTLIEFCQVFYFGE